MEGGRGATQGSSFPIINGAIKKALTRSLQVSKSATKSGKCTPLGYGLQRVRLLQTQWCGMFYVFLSSRQQDYFIHLPLGSLSRILHPPLCPFKLVKIMNANELITPILSNKIKHSQVFCNGCRCIHRQEPPCPTSAASLSIAPCARSKFIDMYEVR